MSTREQMFLKLRQLKHRMLTDFDYDPETAEIILFGSGQSEADLAEALKQRAASESPLTALLLEAAGLYEQSSGCRHA